MSAALDRALTEPRRLYAEGQRRRDTAKAAVTAAQAALKEARDRRMGLDKAAIAGDPVTPVEVADADNAVRSAEGYLGMMQLAATAREADLAAAVQAARDAIGEATRVHADRLTFLEDENARLIEHTAREKVRLFNLRAQLPRNLDDRTITLIVEGQQTIPVFSHLAEHPSAR